MTSKQHLRAPQSKKKEEINEMQMALKLLEWLKEYQMPSNIGADDRLTGATSNVLVLFPKNNK